MVLVVAGCFTAQEAGRRAPLSNRKEEGLGLIWEDFYRFYNCGPVEVEGSVRTGAELQVINVGCRLCSSGRHAGFGDPDQKKPLQTCHVHPNFLFA